MKIDLFDLTTRIIMWILSLIVIYMLILKIIGRSPTLDTIFGSLLGIIGVGLLNLYYKFGRFEGEIKTKLDNLIDSFKALAKDFKEHIKK